ncbi:MAG TPA: plastocyanin/azurin family copper-binding protein [Bryobacteraceae bacterium]|nr:plastocyanin/azurin family copper-binding protein [Bryobacteraceae bacterium]
MNYLYPVTGLIALVLQVAAGDVTGHALITKRLTKKALSPIVYNLRGAVAAPPAPEKSEAANEFGRLAVVLEGGSSRPKAPETVVIDQRNMRFDPDLVIVPVGSTVQFPNADPIFHNIFSLSKTQPFDLGFYPQGQSRTVKFTKNGIVQVYCHIHANMYAAIVVTSSPWYARPSEDGSFSWTDVPAGHYKLTAWHKIAGLFKTEIDVPESGKVDATIRIPIDVDGR